MINYYKILGVNKLSKTEEIEERYTALKNTSSVTPIITESYDILRDYHSRKKYDELYEIKAKYSLSNIPFFGYDFSETAVSPTSQNNGEIKRYKIDDTRFLLYEKKNENGQMIKKFYIEINGKIDLISEDKIQKIKKEYYDTIKKDLLKDKHTK
jgi:DnaJ-class molecular chaperone